MTGVPTPMFVSLKQGTINKSTEIPQSMRQIERSYNANTTVGFLVCNSGASSTIPTGAETGLQFDTTVIQSSGFALGSQNAVFTCPATQGGLWLFNVAGQWAGNVTGQRGMHLLGTSNSTYDNVPRPSSWYLMTTTQDTDGRGSATVLMQMVPGDMMSLTGFQTSGGALGYSFRFGGVRLIAL